MKVLAVILADDYGKPEQGPSYEAYHFAPALEKVFGEVEVFDFGPYLELQHTLQAKVKAKAEEYDPDLIFFVLYEDQFLPETLEFLKNRWRTMNWFCDDQWRCKWSAGYAPMFSEVITTHRPAHEAYQEAGVRSHLSQWAATDLMEPAEHLLADVSFLGWRFPHRDWMIERLKKKGVNVLCYGTGWPNQRLSYPDVANLFNQSKINLNLSNSVSWDSRFIEFAGEKALYQGQKDREQVKGRHFEIPGCGGFQLSTWAPGLDEYFDIGREVQVFGSPEEMEDKVLYYLAHEDERRAIAEAGNQLFDSDHTYFDRFRKIAAHLGHFDPILTK